MREQRQAIPMVDLGRQFAAIEADLRGAIDRVLASQRFILGPEVEALEAELAAYCHCAYAVAVSSGTDAILAALMALNIGDNDEVITTAYSFFSTAGSIARTGARPVFVDVDPATFNIDPGKVEEVVTSRTRAIVAVHLFGQTADMDPLLEIARRHGLIVIEDAAQAIGAEYRGRRAGSLGDAGCFSFFPTKNLGAMGDGGMVTTNDPALAERLAMIRNHGFSPKYHSRVLGGNFRLDAIQAAVLRAKLKYLDEWIESRRRHAARYRALFENAGCVAGDVEPKTPAEIVLPAEAVWRRHVYNQFVIRVHPRARPALVASLRQQNIGCQVYYPVPLHLQPSLAGLGYRRGDLPVSEAASEQALAIPIYPELTAAEQAEVAGTIVRFLLSGAVAV